ncbi:hypothetical protein J3R82DRAFT_201 [Butyriboletus roseoflavus]|nr:hypothetical protein J3R82DRAFT_201 [Butyriboletus roseoflavus]
MHSASATHQHVHFSKKSFKTVLGFGALSFKDVNPTRGRSSADTQRPREPTVRASVDTSRSYQYDCKSRAERSSITDLTFFESRNSSPHNKHAPHNNSVRSMGNLDAAPSRSTRRPPVRIDAQEGPWSISVAETPHDARSYSIYIKIASMSLPSLSVPSVCVLSTFLGILIWAYVIRRSFAVACPSTIIANTAVPSPAPTHNLTLTRTATEVVELHAKLDDSDGASKLPKLPIDIASLPQQPAKRKSTFLNTLSRLASPSTNKVGRQTSVRTPSSPNFGSSTADQLVSPSQEIGDPFTAPLCILS